MYSIVDSPLYSHSAFGPIKNGSKIQLALLSEVIYIILQVRTTKSGSTNRRELLTEVYCIQKYILSLPSLYVNILNEFVSFYLHVRYSKSTGMAV